MELSALGAIVQKIVVLLAALALGGSAFAADMPLPVKAPPPVTPVYSWTGFYIGGDLGGAWTSNTATWTALFPPPSPGANPIAGGTGGSGFLGGFHAGYDYQFAPTWVAGLEGDWMGGNAGGSFSQAWTVTGTSTPFPGTFTNMSSKLDWVSSLRARIGYLVMPNLLAYGTGGVAWGRFDYGANSFCSVATCIVSYVANAALSSTQTGLTAGGGLEWAMTKNWLVRAEYFYYRFNDAPNIAALPAPPFSPISSNYGWSATNVSVARAGLSYKF
jgi:outer membrane immunogenic protein